MTITRINALDYAVVTDTVLADGSFRADTCVRLINGAVLKSFEQSGDIRTGGLLRIHLGPKSLAQVQSLAIGESVTLGEL
jgi:hypothetical protein